MPQPLTLRIALMQAQPKDRKAARAWATRDCLRLNAIQASSALDHSQNNCRNRWASAFDEKLLNMR